MSNKATKLTTYSILLTILVAIGLFAVYPADYNAPGKYEKNIFSSDTSVMTKSKQKFAQKLRHDTKVRITNDNTASLGDFIFNSGGTKKIIANISLKFTNSDKSWYNFNDGKNEILKRGVLLRSAIIDTMMDNPGLQTNNDKIKEKLLLNINHQLSDAVATEIYFNKFIVQH